MKQIPFYNPLFGQMWLWVLNYDFNGTTELLNLLKISLSEYNCMHVFNDIWYRLGMSLTLFAHAGDHLQIIWNWGPANRKTFIIWNEQLCRVNFIFAYFLYATIIFSNKKDLRKVTCPRSHSLQFKVLWFMSRCLDPASLPLPLILVCLSNVKLYILNNDVKGF